MSERNEGALLLKEQQSPAKKPPAAHTTNGTAVRDLQSVLGPQANPKSIANPFVVSPKKPIIINLLDDSPIASKNSIKEIGDIEQGPTVPKKTSVQASGMSAAKPQLVKSTRTFKPNKNAARFTQNVRASMAESPNVDSSTNSVPSTMVSKDQHNPHPSRKRKFTGTMQADNSRTANESGTNMNRKIGQQDMVQYGNRPLPGTDRKEHGNCQPRSFHPPSHGWQRPPSRRWSTDGSEQDRREESAKKPPYYYSHVSFPRGFHARNFHDNQLNFGDGRRKGQRFKDRRTSQHSYPDILSSAGRKPNCLPADGPVGLFVNHGNYYNPASTFRPSFRHTSTPLRPPPKNDQRSYHTRNISPRYNNFTRPMPRHDSSDYRREEKRYRCSPPQTQTHPFNSCASKTDNLSPPNEKSYNDTGEDLSKISAQVTVQENQRNTKRSARTEETTQNDKSCDHIAKKSECGTSSGYNDNEGRGETIVESVMGAKDTSSQDFINNYFSIKEEEALEVKNTILQARNVDAREITTKKNLKYGGENISSSDTKQGPDLSNDVIASSKKKSDETETKTEFRISVESEISTYKIHADVEYTSNKIPDEKGTGPSIGRREMLPSTSLEMTQRLHFCRQTQPFVETSSQKVRFVLLQQYHWIQY
jgi:hypothetical protein